MLKPVECKKWSVINCEGKCSLLQEVFLKSFQASKQDAHARWYAYAMLKLLRQFFMNNIQICLTIGSK